MLARYRHLDNINKEVYATMDKYFKVGSCPPDDMMELYDKQRAYIDNLKQRLIEYGVL